MDLVKRYLLSGLAVISFALVAAVGLPGQASGSEGDSVEPGRDDVSCLAIDHCPEPPPADHCDPAGNCEVPPEPGCHEGPNGDCLPPWCDPSRPISDCPVDPPHPPFCEDGSEVCVPPLPPWCDEEGKCKPPPCQPIAGKGRCWEPPCLMWGTPEDCEWPGPDDPIVCVMGWPSDEPMPDCPPVVDPPICDGGDGEVAPLPAPVGTGGHMAPWRPGFCFRPPPFCEPGSTEPGEGETTPGAPAEDETTGLPEDGSAGDPHPCFEPPFYGCREDTDGNVLCVDPPWECWIAEDSSGLIACPATRPGRPNTKDQVKRNEAGKAKVAKAKARAKARAKAKKAKARAKAKKAKSKARR